MPVTYFSLYTVTLCLCDTKYMVHVFVRVVIGKPNCHAYFLHFNSQECPCRRWSGSFRGQFIRLAVGYYAYSYSYAMRLGNGVAFLQLGTCMIHFTYFDCNEAVQQYRKPMHVINCLHHRSRSAIYRLRRSTSRAA